MKLIPANGHPSAQPNPYVRAVMRVRACRYLANPETMKVMAECVRADENLYDGYLLLYTKNGVLYLRMGDWLIRDSYGYLYVVDDAEFGREYEAVDLP